MLHSNSALHSLKENTTRQSIQCNFLAKKVKDLCGKYDISWRHTLHHGPSFQEKCAIRRTRYVACLPHRHTLSLPHGPRSCSGKKNERKTHFISKGIILGIWDGFVLPRNQNIKLLVLEIIMKKIIEKSHS